MGFTQVDNETVIDDEGNSYFAPSLPRISQGKDVQAVVPSPDPAANPANPVTAQDPLTTSPYASVKQADQAKPLSSANLAPTPKAVTAGQVRNSNIESALPGFSEAGGTLQSDEDVARAQGGIAKNQGETAVAQSELDAQNARMSADKLKLIAEATMKQADEHQARVQAAMQSAKQDLASWQKRNDAAMKAMVDPNHAFTVMSTGSKALWALQFLGAGLGGGDQVNKVSQTLNQIVENDMAAQKANISNLREGLGQERLAIGEKYKVGQDALTAWASDKTIRLQSLGQLMDAKIAEMGQAQAQKVGLLKARDAITQETFKVQNTIADHFMKRAETKAQHSFELGKARLEHEYKMIEQSHQAKLTKEGEQDTLATGTNLGLQMIDKTTGQAVPGGQIKLRPKLEGKEAVKAGQILSQSNKKVSMLQDVKSDIARMSIGDIIRGGTPEFQQKVMDFEVQKAKELSGTALTPTEAARDAKADFGFDITGTDGVVKTAIAAGRSEGDIKAGILGAMENNLRNTGSETLAALGPYIDSTDSQRYDLAYNPQNTRTPAPSTEPEDLNTALVKGANGADVSELLVPGARPPAKSLSSITTEDQERYKSEKTHERGHQGGLPSLAPEEEVRLADKLKSLEGRGSEDILRLSQSYLKDKSFSPEAKQEIRLEVQEKLKEVMPKELEIRESAKEKFKALHDLIKIGQLDKVTIDGKDYTDLGAARKDTVEFNPVFQKFLHSDLVDEMRSRAGLPALKR